MELFKLLGTIAIDSNNASKSIDAITGKAKSAQGDISAAFTGAGKTMSSIGKAIRPVSAAIGVVGGASVKMSLDFEDAMAKVSTIADTTQVPMGQLEKAIIDLSNSTGISSTEIANNVYDAISAGQSTGDAVALPAS